MSTADAVPERVMSQVAEYLGVPVERVREKQPTFSASPSKCANGHEIDFFDFVSTAFDTGLHDKKFMGEFFASDKKMQKETDAEITCAKCGNKSRVHVLYRYSGPHTCS